MAPARIRYSQTARHGEPRGVNDSRGADMPDEAFSPDSVIVVSFSDDDRAYEALTRLKELDSQGQVEVVAAAVRGARDEGHGAVKDEVGEPSFAGTAGGGLVGLLIGILGGPLGVLLGGATGLMIG